MRLKKGVRVAGLRGESLVAILAANDLCQERGIELVLTSVCEGGHQPGSRHFLGLGFDLRIRDMPEEFHKDFRDELAGRLGDDYDVMLEKDHIHVEFDPEKGVNL